MANEVTNERDARLHDVLLAYVEGIQAGRTPDRHSLLAAHPDLRPELEDFFASHDAVERLAAPLRRARTAEADMGSTYSGVGKARGAEADTAVATSATLPLGELGDFRLLREIGRGGMGVVYEAEQISLRRQVALKVLPFAAAIDPRQLQRFRNESLAAAHLHHENIVPVYAVGSERGVHYYAMQFIEGQSLAALIAGLRGRAGVPPNAPSAPGSRPVAAAETTGPFFGSGPPDTQAADMDSALAASISRERSAGGRRYFDWVAGLGRQAALALEHAHQLGIIHRDIKPANLLLDPRGQLWVTDFGLAQVSGDAGVTVTGELLGTMRYASPEQALGKKSMVDHRSDIYSLGATLYELLTLQPIFDGRDRHELLRQIAVEEPRPPRSVDRAIPTELETIVMKACAKESTERYATAQELADDVQRFLEDRPIQARRPSLVEKATKWGRRHRPLVAAGVVALVLSVAGLSVATAISVRAYERERVKTQEAEESFRKARDAVVMFEQISEDELAGQPHLQGLRKRLLQAALSYYRTFIDQRRDDPTIQTELMASRERVRKILGALTTLMGFGDYRLIYERSVQDDLALSDEQRKRISTLELTLHPDDRFRGSGMGPKEWEQRLMEMARDQELRIAEILTGDQLGRFQQIVRQQRGLLGTFMDSDIAEAIQLTGEQQTNARKILDETKREAMSNFDRDCSLEQKQKLSETAWRTGQEKMLAVLTTEQKRKWEELTGRPFAGTISMLPFFSIVARHSFGGPGGPHGGPSHKKGRPPGRPDHDHAPPPLPPLEPLP
jgi:eukaryotic-like serine/threonine-protein kinase